jgi:adenylylsulfate kinase
MEGMFKMNEEKCNNLTSHPTTVNQDDREKLLGQKGQVILLTGLSGAGKSTIAYAVEKKLHDLSKLTYVLDGDSIRLGLNEDLGFSKEDRIENMRRMKEISIILSQTGVIVLLSFIAPIEKERLIFADTFRERYTEVYVTCPLEICRERDPKGLYEKVERGMIKEFTGVASVYEPPKSPHIVINTHELSLEASVEVVVEHILSL